tara:strand:+ start:231 stop:377 length:147 start_codon:yes stop_codon:yes gene_type:complete
MTFTTLYDGRISGATIVTALSAITTVSAASLVAIPYSNGQRVVMIGET